MNNFFNKLSKKTILITIGIIVIIVGIFSFMQYRQHVIDSTWNASEVQPKNKTKKVVKKVKKHIEDAKTVEFNAAGTYRCGTDFNPGTYYVVLTKFEFGGEDVEKKGDVFLDASGDDSFVELWKEKGTKRRSVFDKGDKLELKDNFSPNWTLKLFSEKDYKKDEGKTTSVSTKKKEGNLKSSGNSNNSSNGSKKDTWHTQHVRNYVGRNAANVGSMRLSGYFMDDYASTAIKIVFVADNGEEITEDNRSEYVVKSQNPKPGTDINITYLKDENGKETTLGTSSLNEIVLNVKKE